MTPILVVASLTLAASFLCSLLEAALYAISPARVELLIQRKVRGAQGLADLRKEVERPIAAILTVNTVAHTLGAAWCGAMVGELHGSAAVGIFAAIFTVLVLAITEIVPKSLGVRYATQLGTSIVLPIRIMIWSTYPVVWLAQIAMKRLTGSGATGHPTEDEVLVLSRLAARAGSVRKDEHRWVKNALELDQVTAGELCTPRTVVEALTADQPVAELVRNLESWTHSRIPVTEDGNLDQVIGMVHRREVLDTALQRPEEPLTVRDCLRELALVPECTPAHRLLDQFIAERTHMLGVVDEYGGFEGVVTLEDVLERLLGEAIMDEHDRHEDLQQLAREQAGQVPDEPSE